MLHCDHCRMSLQDIKDHSGRKHDCLWTSHISNRVLCSDCIIEEYEKNGREIPNNSLKAINEKRKR
jgi:hypothetical protein